MFVDLTVIIVWFLGQQVFLNQINMLKREREKERERRETKLIESDFDVSCTVLANEWIELKGIINLFYNINNNNNTSFKTVATKYILYI